MSLEYITHQMRGNPYRDDFAGSLTCMYCCIVFLSYCGCTCVLCVHNLNRLPRNFAQVTLLVVLSFELIRAVIKTLDITHVTILFRRPGLIPASYITLQVNPTQCCGLSLYRMGRGREIEMKRTCSL